MRTRVGYSGGTKERPTYRDLDDHSEAIQIDYDPSRISFRELARHFWTGHAPARKSWSTQYKAVLFFHDPEQERVARATKAELEKELGKTVHTEILPAGEFWRAEDYHQKYRLRNAPELMAVFRDLYPTERAFVDSTQAARVNGLLSGWGALADVRADLDPRLVVQLD